MFELWREATMKYRGGAVLVEEVTAVLEKCSYRAAYDSSSIVGFSVIYDRVILALFVVRKLRRHGVGTALLDDAVNLGAVDGRSLPGDRGTKSLYESRGWKARMLTMSPAATDDVR